MTAIGDDHWCAPVQVSALVTTTAPVSPSTPVRRLLFMNQTMASVRPSVVVAMGDVANPPCATHQTVRGTGGAPAGMRTDMINRPAPPAPGQIAPLAENVTCTPAAVV